MPQHHWRHAQKMRKQHAFQPKMAEKRNRVHISMQNPVVISFPPVPMAFQQLVKRTGHPRIFFCNISFLHARMIQPCIPVIKFCCFCPVLWQPVPCNRSLFFIRAVNQRCKFPQPCTLLCFPVHLFQGQAGRIFRASKRRYIKAVNIHSANPPRQKLCFLPSLAGQGICFIIRVCMPDNQNFHNSCFLSCAGHTRSMSRPFQQKPRPCCPVILPQFPAEIHFLFSHATNQAACLHRHLANAAETSFSLKCFSLTIQIQVL